MSNSIAGYFANRARQEAANLKAAQESIHKSHSRYADVNLYKNYLPTSDTFIISEDAVREALYYKIQDMIDRGESLKSIPYDVFEQFIGDRFYGGWQTAKHMEDWNAKFQYELLCYDGKSRQEMEKFALEAAEKYRNGDDITEHEYKWIGYMLNGNDRGTIDIEHRASVAYKELIKEFERNGIVLGEGETLEITMTCLSGKYDISGIEDEAIKQKIKEILESAEPYGSSPYGPILISGIHYLNNHPNYGKPLSAAPNAWSSEYQNERRSNEGKEVLPAPAPNAHSGSSIAIAVGLVERYLKAHTNGSVTLKDLSLDSKGFIHGLPLPLSTKLNNVKIYNPYIPLQDQGVIASVEERQEILDLSEIKKYFLSVIGDMQRVGYDNLPRLDFYFRLESGTIKPVYNKYS